MPGSTLLFSMSKITYLTEEGLRKLQEDLAHLKNVERPSISRQIAEARDKGDLSENAEYDAAKDAQGLLELKISKLEELVASARLIDESKLDTSKVSVLCKVRIRNMANKAEMAYVLVAENEADLKAGKISVSSPIGKGLLGKKVGEVADITTPGGVLKFEILDISLA
jgi:transcription elongation factor GreA